MRKIGIMLLMLLFVASCKPKAKLPVGSAAYLKTKDLIEKVKAQSLAFETLVLEGKGRYQSGSSKQSFRFEMRIAKDSLIWVDLADPFLGLKVARGPISQDEVAYYNRLERNYQKGSSSEIAQKIGFRFDFQPLMSVLSASYLDWNQNWYQDYQPGVYQLVNYPLNQDQIPPSPEYPLMTQSFSAKSYRPSSFRFQRPQEGQNLLIRLDGYRNFGEILFPAQMHFEYLEKSEIIIDLEITDLKRNESLSYPFRIPGNYEQL